MSTIEELLNEDDVQARMALYLRLLYSEPDAAAARTALAAGRAAPATLAVLRGLDFERLQVERRARLSQLILHLGKQSQPLWVALGGETRAVVSAFANSPLFWQVRGRTIVENFCLFAHERLEADGRPFLADLAELVGTMSALMAGLGPSSPWRDHDVPGVALPDAEGGESFVARFDLIDDDGTVRSTASEAACPG